MIENDNLYIKNYTSDTIMSSQFEELSKFVLDQQHNSPKHPAMINMGNNNPAGLLFNIKNKLRWTSNNGNITVLKKSDKIIGISCVEKSETYKNLGIGGIRCWLDSKERTNHYVTEYLLSDNLLWCESHHLDGMLLTFNDYNKWIYDAIKRNINGKTIKFLNIWSNWWDDCILIDSQLEIRYTLQWCVIKPLIKGPIDLKRL